MSREWFIRLVKAAAVTIAITAVCQELEKPKEERKWHGEVGIVPYDFRMPTVERFKESYWNPSDERVFTPEFLGIGWAINFYTLLEKFRLIGEAYTSEEDFLMPTESIKAILEQNPLTAL